MADIPVQIFKPHSLLPRDNATYSRSVGIAVSEDQTAGQLGRISSEVLRGNLNNFLSNFGQALTGIPVALAGYHVEEIELSLDISIKGGVSLIIGGMDPGCNAAMKLTLRRSSAG
jgi:hypothetical protein